MKPPAGYCKIEGNGGGRGKRLPKEVVPLILIPPYEQIGNACAWALLMEVSASPKPGLVDRLGSGAHTDMDFSTFLASITAITPYYCACAQVGMELETVDDTTLSRIRPLGIACEEAMLEATGGVNTHKGAVFSLGILACAAGYCRERLGDLSAATVCACAGVIAAEAVKDFYKPDYLVNPTKGRRLYDTYGIQGIRGEAASGFASVRRWALPVLEELEGSGRDLNDIHLQALLHLMANVCDTNVISRGGIAGMKYVQDSAQEALGRGGALTPEGKDFLRELDREYIRRNLSPGGSADLLSAAILLHRLPGLFAGAPAPSPERSEP